MPSLPALLQAGGKVGVVSVFGSQVLEAGGLGAEDVAPALLSQKLHKGWVRRQRMLQPHVIAAPAPALVVPALQLGCILFPAASA